MEEKPVMHCQEEIERDLKSHTFITDEILMRWFQDRYSVSKHILTMYSTAVGLNAKQILEIGFGRSSFALMRAAHDTGGRFLTCDTRDFSYLMSPEEKAISTFVNGLSDQVWAGEYVRQGVDMAFLDYFSGEDVKPKFVKNEIDKCLSFMKQNGVILIHDVCVDKYSVGKVLEKLGKRRYLEVTRMPYNYGLGIIRYTGKSKYGRIEDSWIKKKESE